MLLELQFLTKSRIINYYLSRYEEAKIINYVITKYRINIILDTFKVYF